MKNFLAGFAVILLSMLYSSGSAAEVGVTLRLERGEATLADTIRLEVGVSDSRSSDAEPVIHGLESFLVTQGGTSSRVEIINGKVNAGLTYTYYIQPQQNGVFEIGPAEIEVDGRKLESNSVKLVVKASANPSGSDRGPVFLEASIASPDVYVEEQVLYILKLYRRVNVDNLSLSLPQVEHLIFKQLGKPREYQATIAGESYKVLEIRYSLSAPKQGQYVIGPSKMNMTVRGRQSQSLFDDFFKDPFFQSPFSTFSSGRPLTVATNPIELNVLALPEAGKPDDYSGLVGDFRMESSLQPTRLMVGESATLTVQISGKGNINRIPDIDLPELPFARTYGDQPLLETEPDDQGIGGKKTMKWALVPLNAGQFEIPVLKLSFFNPDTEKYAVLHTTVHTLSVLPGQTPASADSPTPPSIAGSAETPAKKEIQQIGKDILPIHMTADNLSVPYRELTRGWLFWLALIGPLSIYLMLLAGVKLVKHSPDRRSQSRSKNAFRKLSKRCRQGNVGCADQIDAFRDYLNDKYNLSIGTLTPDDVEHILRSKGVTNDTTKKICTLIQRLENTLYAGVDTKPMDATAELLRLVKTLEKESR
jgi:hypothetical protein